MGCGSSTQVHAVHAPDGQVSVVAMKPKAGEAGAPTLAKQEPEAVTPMDVTDDERSKNSTPLTTHQGTLGDTSPAERKAGDETQSDAPAFPDECSTNRSAAADSSSQQQLPGSAEPLPAPLDVDSMKLPVHEESVPYWERLAPLPTNTERPQTSSRRPGSSAGKLVVYQTEKQKKLKAEAKKKREAELSSSPLTANKLPPVVGARSALPPLKERKKKTKKPAEGSGEGALVLAPVKPVRDWKGSSGGEAWEVGTEEMSSAPAPETLKFESPAKAEAVASE